MMTDLGDLDGSNRLHSCFTLLLIELLLAATDPGLGIGKFLAEPLRSRESWRWGFLVNSLEDEWRVRDRLKKAVLG